jgi:type IV pilus assembly protein PilP
MRIMSLTLAGLTLVATLAHAQAPPSAGAPSAASPSAAPPSTAAGAPAPTADKAIAAAKTVAEKAEDAAEPQGFTYNPEGRRDPFVSLLRRGVDARANAPKASGIGGLGVSEVSLRGTVVSHGAFVGILQGVDSKNYIVRVGDRLSDGTIRTITADSMVILQQVNDPLSLEKQREVRKLLRQTEEAK